jgi:hypothetical protein
MIPIVIVVSLICHQVGSFFGFQFLGCLLTTVFQNAMICTTSKTLHLVTLFIWLATSLGISQIGTTSAPSPSLCIPPMFTHSSKNPCCSHQPSLPPLLAGAGCNHEYNVRFRHAFVLPPCPFCCKRNDSMFSNQERSRCSSHEGKLAFLGEFEVVIHLGNTHTRHFR